MNKNHPILIRSIVFILLPLVILLLYFGHYAFQSLPIYQGEAAVSGVKAPINLSRDKNGIVHIQAKSDSDAFFALGYAHAQDRLWQLEVQKRTAQGRLSEIFGKSSLEMDIWFRTLGLYHKAKASWPNLSIEARQSLKAYTNGINAWIDSQNQYPLEFTLLDLTPEHWQVYDSLAYSKLFALNLSKSMSQEITHQLASRQLNQKQMKAIFQTYPTEAPTTVNSINLDNTTGFSQMLNLQRTIEQQLTIGGKFIGSNAWVVAPQNTDNGQAFIANDPHLGLQIPSLWYAATLQGDKLNVSGMTLVGLPLVIFGRNADIAWGGTAMMTDNQDLYIERVNPDDPSSYYAQGQWQPFKISKETFNVRNDFPAAMRGEIEPINVTVRQTLNGPIISDVFDVFDHPVSLRWTALTDKDTTYEAIYKLNYANDWSSFKQALSHQVAPSINYLYIDRQGNIGYLGAGQIPIRQTGNGQVPVPGWTKEHQWIGSVPIEQWPQSYNPKQGFIINANNKPVDDNYPHFISDHWASPARATRITQLIEQKLAVKGKLNQDDMKVIQADTYSLSAQILLPILTDLSPKNDTQAQAITYLQNWDGDMSADNPASTIFTVWFRFLRNELFSDELTTDWNKPTVDFFLSTAIAQITTSGVYDALTKNKPNFCDDVTLTEIKSCEQILHRSLDKTLERLNRLLGSDMSDWRWAQLQSSLYRHYPFSDTKLLNIVFERQFESQGDENTVNVSSSSFIKSQGYLATFGAGFRQIIGLSPQQTSHVIMNSTGQSGNLLSEHYDDMIKPFAQVLFYNIGDKQENMQELTLLPLQHKEEAQ